MEFDILVDIYTERLALKGTYKGTVYQRLVAASYKIAPVMEENALPNFKDLIKKFSRQFEFLQTKYEYSPVDKDPYTSSKHLSSEIQKQKHQGIKRPEVKVLGVLPGPDTDETKQGHPLFDNEFNTKLRWVHDIIAHHYGKHPFSARGEYGAYNRHLKTLGPNTLASGALFTEVVGQTSCYYIYGDYIEQKVILLTDYDWINVGLLRNDSKLNKYFEVVGKTMIPVQNFDKKHFREEFSTLYEELLNQENNFKGLSPLTKIFD